MAATNGILRFASGRALSVHFPASGAAGTYLPISGNEVALATSNDKYRISGANDRIVDIVQGPATGTLQIEINGNPLHSMIDMSQHGATNSGRPAINVPVALGEELALKVVSALAA